LKDLDDATVAAVLGSLGDIKTAEDIPGGAAALKI
jgi:hypothetical protein